MNWTSAPEEHKAVRDQPSEKRLLVPGNTLQIFRGLKKKRKSVKSSLNSPKWSRLDVHFLCGDWFCSFPCGGVLGLLASQKPDSHRQRYSMQHWRDATFVHWVAVMTRFPKKWLWPRLRNFSSENVRTFVASSVSFYKMALAPLYFENRTFKNDFATA